MNIFTDSKKTKKIIISILIIMLFNFCYPKNVQAAFEMEDIVAAPAKIIWELEKGVLIFLNNIFTNDGNKASLEEDEETGITSLRINLTPDNIIKGKFILFDANIFKIITNDKGYYDYEDGGSVANGKIALRETIAGWYYALRNLAIVALLSVLVYVGIRMIISTVAQDKAKYKLMFKDWLVALCLVVVMHYIMIGILNITSDLVDALGDGSSTNMLKNLTENITGVLSKKGDSKHYTYVNSQGKTIELFDVYANLVVVGGIVWYTFIFAVKYLKREFTIIFLILLGPVSCITYPIDKISDGKAQAFNKWFSEFLYQVIIQPFHLLLYIVLVGSAIELANANVLYALICFAVIIPAEKFIKEMFGFKDKLGSPLGAFASGALASKALSALSGGKKGGSSGNEEDNNSTANQLSPKTVKNPELEKGSEENSGDKIKQNENPALEAGEDTEGNTSNASAAGAFQDSDDPIGDAEREANEERIAEGLNDDNGNALAAGTGAAIGADAADENGNTNGETEADRAQGIAEKDRKFNDILSKGLAIHNERSSKKWGSTSRKQRWINRGKKAAKGTLKFATRAAGVGLGATVGGAIGLMTGKGAVGAMIGAGIGRGASNKVIKGVAGAVNTGKDYANAFRGDAGREKQALQAFKSDRKQIDKAVLSFRDSNGGREPSSVELDREMNQRFELSRYGLDDSQIDTAIGSYQSLIAEGKSADVAGVSTAYTAKLAKDYSPKDFRSEKTMSEALKTITQDFQSRGVTAQVAEANARKYLTNAATMRKTEIALPNQTIDVPITSKDVSSSLGINQSNLTTTQVERVQKLTVNLHKAGLSNSQIKQIASNCKGGSATEVIDKFEVQVEYLNDSGAQDEAKMTIEARNNGSNATSEQIREEMRERLILKSTFNVKNEKDVTALRDLEQTKVKGKSQIQYAREFANKNRGRLNNQGHMVGAKQDLIKTLMKEGSSSSKATKDAENIIRLAAEYNNETITWDNK